ncbi:MAG: hypothetical protein AB1393_09175 [Candidatus Edwardsbacteria bacterium]
MDKVEILLEEYKITSDPVKHYSNVRYLLVTFLFTLSIGVLQLFLRNNIALPLWIGIVVAFLIGLAAVCFNFVFDKMKAAGELRCKEIEKQINEICKDETQKELLSYYTRFGNRYEELKNKLKQEGIKKIYFTKINRVISWIALIYFMVLIYLFILFIN